MTANMLNINKETYRQILHDQQLTEKKVVPEWCIRILFRNKKDTRIEICFYILNQMKPQPDLLENFITCNKSWTFQYNVLKQKDNRCTGRLPPITKNKKGTKAIPMLFHIMGIMIDWVSGRQE